MLRDVFHVMGFILFDHTGKPCQCVLNQADPLARGLATGLYSLLASEHIAVSLGET